MLFDFYKKNPNDKIWWTGEFEYVEGKVDANLDKHLFSFDKKKIYDLFKDYPHNLTPEEKDIFDKENPKWKEFFEGKNINQ